MVFFLTVSLYLSVLPSLENGTQSHPGMNKAMKTNCEVCVCGGGSIYLWCTSGGRSINSWESITVFLGECRPLSQGLLHSCHSDLKNKIYEPQRPSLKSITDSELLGMGVGR